MLTVIYSDVENSIYNIQASILKIRMSRNGLLQTWREAL